MIKLNVVVLFLAEYVAEKTLLAVIDQMTIGGLLMRLNQQKSVLNINILNSL